MKKRIFGVFEGEGDRDEKHQYFSQLKMSLVTQSLTLPPIEPRE